MSKLPGFQDDVKHKNKGIDVTGTVIAEFPDWLQKGERRLDVRGDDGKIYYRTPAKNWNVVRTRLEKEGENEEL